MNCGIQPPDGVMEMAIPSLSMASTQVVSFASSASSILWCAVWYSEGCLGGLDMTEPGRKSYEACAPINLRRSEPYSLDSRRAAGIVLNLGSP